MNVEPGTGVETTGMPTSNEKSTVSVHGPLHTSFPVRVSEPSTSHEGD
jgi:hypothetical protein